MISILSTGFYRMLSNILPDLTKQRQLYFINVPWHIIVPFCWVFSQKYFNRILHHSHLLSSIEAENISGFENYTSWKLTSRVERRQLSPPILRNWILLADFKTTSVEPTDRNELRIKTTKWEWMSLLLETSSNWERIGGELLWLNNFPFLIICLFSPTNGFT